MVWVEIDGTKWHTFAVVYVVDNLMFNSFELHGSGSIKCVYLSLTPGAQTSCCSSTVVCDATKPCPWLKPVHETQLGCA